MSLCIVYYRHTILQLFNNYWIYSSFNSFLNVLCFWNLICLTKKLFWLDWKFKEYAWQKSFFKQLLRYKYFIIKKRQWSFVDFIISHSDITLSLIHQMSQTFFIQQNLFWLIVATTFLLTPFAFSSWLLSFTKEEYIFGFNPTNYSIATPAVFLSFYQTLICLNYHNILI